MRIAAFSKHFGNIKDPRQSAKISYPLFDVIFLAVCASIRREQKIIAMISPYLEMVLLAGLNVVGEK
ncbi:transposase family protein [Photobacterium damselae]|uniref:transposase family protein n=1 Tax=Photobacterium damselae TaxID=38293 RepID=UPI0023D957BA|nr:transposase family protein [Photobacterium damselae]